MRQAPPAQVAVPALPQVGPEALPPSVAEHLPRLERIVEVVAHRLVLMIALTMVMLVVHAAHRVDLFEH